MTSSTVSSESAPRSSSKRSVGRDFAFVYSEFSTMICLTRSSVDAMYCLSCRVMRKLISLNVAGKPCKNAELISRFASLAGFSSPRLRDSTHPKRRASWQWSTQAFQLGLFPEPILVCERAICHPDLGALVQWEPPIRTRRFVPVHERACPERRQQARSRTVADPFLVVIESHHACRGTTREPGFGQRRRFCYGRDRCMLLVLLGVGQDDEQSDAHYLADKIIGLRIFEDQEEKMNRSVVDVGGAILAVYSVHLVRRCPPR